MTFFLLFIPILGSILLIVNFILAPHKPDKNKDSQFECGFSSFTQMSRLPFSISFFIYALLFLLFDLEILLVYPYVVSAYNNSIYGLIVMLVFFILLTIGFVFELGKKALQIESRQTKALVLPTNQISIKNNFNDNEIDMKKQKKWNSVINNSKLQLNILWKMLRRELHSSKLLIKKHGFWWFICVLLFIFLCILSAFLSPVLHCDSDSDPEQTADWSRRELVIEARSSNSRAQAEDRQSSQSDNKDKNLDNERSTFFDMGERMSRVEYEPEDERSTFFDPGERLNRIEYEPDWRDPNWEYEYLADKARKDAYKKMIDEILNAKPESEQGKNDNLGSLDDKYEAKDSVTNTLSEKALGKRRLTEDIPSWVGNIPNVEDQNNFNNTLSEKALGKRKLVEFSPEPVSNKKPNLEDLRSEELLEEDTQRAIRESLNFQAKSGESSKNPVDNEDSDDSDNTSVYSSINGTESPGTYQKKVELLQRDEFIKEEQRNKYFDDED